MTYEEYLLLPGVRLPHFAHLIAHPKTLFDGSQLPSAKKNGRTLAPACYNSRRVSRTNGTEQIPWLGGVTKQVQ